MVVSVDYLLLLDLQEWTAWAAHTAVPKQLSSALRKEKLEPLQKHCSPQGATAVQPARVSSHGRTRAMIVRPQHALLITYLLGRGRCPCRCSCGSWLL